MIEEAPNLALVATPSASWSSTRAKLTHLNSGFEPKLSSSDTSGAFNFVPKTDTQWIQYDWSKPISTDRTDIFWLENPWGIERPIRYEVQYWDGAAFVPVRNPRGLGLDKDRYNTTRFDAVTTTKIRIVMVGNGKNSPGILQWKVYNRGPVPAFAPAVAAGVDRTLVLGGRTYMNGKAKWLAKQPGDAVRWSQVSGPGTVVFEDPAALRTAATVSTPGDYVLELAGIGAGGVSKSVVQLRVEEGPPSERLDVVYTTPYAITSPFWTQRAKALIVNWIPHCIDYCQRTDLKDGVGGLDNFIESAKALRGEPHGPHRGFVFSNAWVHQTVEAMCIALMVDPQGDAEIAAAQAHMRDALARWIPIILAAQHPDGYLQTAYTLADRKEWPDRWSPEHRGDHEGYVSGYFIESAINHYTLTGGQDRRLYDAAKRLADCWVANIGPGKKAWYDGHQEMEQALVRFGRFVNDMEGKGRGDAYIALARFLLESRRGGSEYDQSHLPPREQYEAVGHAVRAVYFYSGMADIAAETGDRDYQSAVMSLWDNMVNRKYYVTGGVGSGDTSEGFGDDYGLRNDSYCESCSSCGLIFFQYKLNIAYRDAKYADLYEETMYNALLGATDLEGRNFTYTNPLLGSARYAWHNCPCCVGNIPRTLLMMPTWAYAKDKDSLFVNLFVGSRINVGEIAGTQVEMVQETDYPWNGKVALTVNPQKAGRFAVHVRVPDRQTSQLYAASPQIRGLNYLKINGKTVVPRIERGYAVLDREWKKGDRVEFELPMAVQRLASADRVAATRGKVALRYGPLVYNVELADQPDLGRALSAGALTPEWRPSLLGGVMAIAGQWGDGSPMLAVPNYARMNRAGPSNEFPTRDPDYKDSAVWMATA
ncbi:MAG: Tat pathway signal protein [Sphingomonas sp.]|nr:MAG: Tat pathway signal protein [Sphingomonas sp.]